MHFNFKHKRLGGLSYARLCLKEVDLSHAAALYLLQGSLRQLFTDVLVYEKEESSGSFFNLAYVESGPIWKPPPRLDVLVLARLLEKPEGIGADDVALVLLQEELRCKGS